MGNLCHSLCTDTKYINNSSIYLGGHRTHPITYELIAPYIDTGLLQVMNYTGSTFYFVDHIRINDLKQYIDICYLVIDIPLEIIISFLPLVTGCRIAALHGIKVSCPTIALLQSLFKGHRCAGQCEGHRTVLSIDPNKYDSKIKRREQTRKRMKFLREKVNSDSLVNNEAPLPGTSKTDINRELQVVEKIDMMNISCTQETKFNMKYNSHEDFVHVFPPKPLDKALAHTIIKSTCDTMETKQIEEAGCAVCGQLVPKTSLSRLSAVKKLLHVLACSGVSRKERLTDSDKISECSIVLDDSCNQICSPCRASIHNNEVPKYALAQGLWIGQVPEELSSLRFVERMLVARVRQSCCCIRIASGMHKMKANVIAFQSPIPKVYNILPPPKDDIQEVLAIMFTGPSKPTASDYKRTPCLVRRNHVKKALEWLRLNHIDYEDITISDMHLQEYDEDMPPVCVEYKESVSNKTPEGMSLFDIDDEDGTSKGDCSFTVHGLTGGELNTMSTTAIKARALQHLSSYGKVLSVGHAEHPESIWNNPHLYPQMFPWLFPYGLGGIGSLKGISEKEHKRRLLMYHDKRFQTDPTFPFVAFSHEQIKASTSQSFLLADKHIFQDITDRLLSLDINAVNSLIERLASEGEGKPETEEEKKCYQIIKDLDHVQGRVKGSATSKKWMRNEIWSLINHCGAPFWYITLSPADIKHPICLYYAGTNETFEPDLMPYDERLRLICQNPVAGARFFHFVVTVFIKHVLGVDAKHRGLYGKTCAYYGTVEQQGRLTLHLHLLLWLVGNLTPQEMRDHILDHNSDFQKKIIAWIESCQVGEFLTGTQHQVLERVHEKENLPDYKDPTETMPIPPPDPCRIDHKEGDKCVKCDKMIQWCAEFAETVDDIISKSNIHNCERGTNKDGSRKKNLAYLGCKDNKFGKCKARFPRPTFENTHVDPETGSVNVRKKEEWINSLTPHLTYLFRCNTDVTCMWSGTALKAVILYISDYITKTGLKTHVVFDVIRSIFDKHQDILDGNISQKEKARKLMSKMANLLSTKLEMGAPMVCMYLLGNPDHYTGHIFIPFNWKSYVNEVYHAWNPENKDIIPPKITLIRNKTHIVGLSPVHDYIYRPTEIEDMCLYDWVRRCNRKPLPSSKAKSKMNYMQKKLEKKNDENRDSDEDSDFEDNCETVNIPLPSSMYRFMESHPLYSSHGTIVKTENPGIVATFFGTLPRHDQGDREYYCLAMLTLFKHWRDPLTLKFIQCTWEDAFLDHKFTDRQQELINNFNIKYECLDARDDYGAQLKNGGNNAFFPYGQENEHEHDEFDPELFTKLNKCDEFENLYQDDNMILQRAGRSELWRQREAEGIRNVLHNTGWSKKLLDEATSYVKLPYSPDLILPASEWKRRVQYLKKTAIENRQNRNTDIGSNKTTIAYHKYDHNNVMVIDKSYLENKFYTTKHETSIDNICKTFNLTEEQECAFKIVAHHSIMPLSDQLKMYIGGIGGTGKSRVISAISNYFVHNNERFRFVIVAPTGSAAALLGGSTYHSMFGINDKTGKVSEKNLAQIRTQLEGIDYVFFDEVSMLSAHDLYKISAQLCRVLNKPDVPFGGMNMIFAGDFGQLPPPMGAEGVSLYSRAIGRFATKLHSQEETMGRSLWHQITTVVLLRKNMWQQNNSTEDKKYRKCLENMRFKDCDPEDIQFLRTRITSFHSQKASICDKDFRNVAIITAKNAQKDEINKIGCIRFSEERNQQLTHFYSDDSTKQRDDDAQQMKKKRKNRTLHEINPALQTLLWDLPHSSADKHIAGKLSLCIGLPVMIKCNAATELCITNGQEATVVGWQSKLGSKDQLMLDTLFLELNNPPSQVRIDGLRENVVPLTCSTNNITCTLPDDSRITILRSQVEVLPNFAMTDFASQGKTRPFNPVDLNNCRSHQAYYTALSRSATAAGTIILQGFDPKKITGKASGALRQEYRDLELLDEITKLQYHSKLPKTVIGDRRNDLIHAYRLHKGPEYVPATVHNSIRWSDLDPMLEPIDDNIGWEIVKKVATPSKSSNTTNMSNKSSHKHKLEDNEILDMQSSKRKCYNNDMLVDKPEKEASIDSLTPSGLSWHRNSCAYDSILCIIYAIWMGNRSLWTDYLKNLNNPHLGKLAKDFERVQRDLITLNSARDRLCRSLQKVSNERFPLGDFASVSDVLECILKTGSVTVNTLLTCLQHDTSTSLYSQNTSCIIAVGANEIPSISHWMANFWESSQHRCNICHDNLQMKSTICQVLPILAFQFVGQNPTIDSRIIIDVNTIRSTYILRGVIYFGEYHYTSRLVNEVGMAWFHDGIATGDSVVYEGNVKILI